MDKLAMGDFLRVHGLPVPATYSTLSTAREGLSIGEVTFPLIVKPRWGTASIGLYVLHDDEELELAHRLVSRTLVNRGMLARLSHRAPDHSVLIQQYLSGAEHGVDVVNDLRGRYVGTLARRKLAMRSGETDQAVTVSDDRLEWLGETVGTLLGHVGVLDCDVVIQGHQFYVIDTNPRFGGGYQLSHTAGANISGGAHRLGVRRRSRAPVVDGRVRCHGIEDRSARRDHQARLPRTYGPAKRVGCERKSVSHRVAIVGAGPYGLAAASHLMAAGVDVRVFGETMESWKRQMPAGIFLRSPWQGSSIADPQAARTLDRYQATHANELSDPVPLDGFIRYGEWFQLQAVPQIDRRRVARLDAASPGFRVALDDGTQMGAERVAVATGIGAFARRLPQFEGLPSALVTHSSEHDGVAQFRGREVIVVGAGQSALESATLLYEAGADVEVVARAPAIRWLRHGGRTHTWLHSGQNPFRKLLYPPGNVGPPVLNWIIETPDVFRRMPSDVQHRVAQRANRPAATGWLRPRAQGVRVTTGHKVAEAIAHGERIKLTLDDGTRRSVEHVVLATGFQVDNSSHPFLSPDIVRALRLLGGYPLLDQGFESSVLHFLGAAAAYSFGPLMRFVAGTKFAARGFSNAITSHGSRRS